MVSQILPVTVVHAANVEGSVVINEIAWAGTADNSNDEWIELYNTTNTKVDLKDWQIVDDGSSTYKITAGEIAPHGYFLIEDVEASLNTAADSVIGLSLANAGDSLALQDETGAVIDTVNAGGGAWYAGDATSKATMERIDPAVRLDNANNWASAEAENGALGRSGGAILGTPKGANSHFGGSGPEVVIEPEKSELSHGAEVTFEVEINEATDLFSYGFEMDYDSELLKFISVDEGEFLQSGNVDTAFNSALENGVPGTLLVGGARLLNPPQGVDGSGTLFEMTFEVVGQNGDTGEIDFAPASFITDSAGDLQARFAGSEIEVKDRLASVVTNLQAKAGLNRYSLELTWTEPVGGAEKYVVKKKLPDGTFVDLGETVVTNFLDKDGVANGGKIVPAVDYTYQVIAVSAGLSSDAVSVVGNEVRGVKGDIDRNDRVDGRDIEKLARAYGSEFSDEEYNALSDLNFDGHIDGQDLIELAASFGLKYKA